MVPTVARVFGVQVSSKEVKDDRTCPSQPSRSPTCVVTVSAPQLFRLLHAPEYMHPNARTAEGSMTSVVGAGLDELMRHVPCLRSQCIQALVTAMKEVSFVTGASKISHVSLVGWQQICSYSATRRAYQLLSLHRYGIRPSVCFEERLRMDPQLDLVPYPERVLGSLALLLRTHDINVYGIATPICTGT